MMVASVSAHNHVKSIILLPRAEGVENPLRVFETEEPGMISIEFSAVAVETKSGSISLDVVDVAAVSSSNSVLLGLSSFRSSVFVLNTTDLGRGGTINFG